MSKGPLEWFKCSPMVAITVMEYRGPLRMSKGPLEWLKCSPMVAITVME
jgi:hypothetical protein